MRRDVSNHLRNTPDKPVSTASLQERVCPAATCKRERNGPEHANEQESDEDGWYREQGAVHPGDHGEDGRGEIPNNKWHVDQSWKVLPS